MTVSTRDFLKAEGLMFKAAYRGASVDMTQDRPINTPLWDITISHNQQRGTFEYRAEPLKPGAQVEHPTPEEALAFLAEKLKPALMGHVAFGELRAEETKPFVFGVAHLARDLEAASDDVVRANAKVSREYVSSIGTYNDIVGTLGKEGIQKLVSEVDFSPVPARDFPTRQMSPSMR